MTITLTALNLFLVSSKFRDSLEEVACNLGHPVPITAGVEHLHMADRIRLAERIFIQNFMYQ